MYALSITEQFHRDYKRLEQTEQQAIKRALERLRDDIHYPSLRVKKMSGREEIWEASASRDLRITFMFQEPETLILRTCGHHDDALKRQATEGKSLGGVYPGVVYDPGLFTREILPKLGAVKLREIVEVAGLSKSYASTIRLGKYTPHVSTWAALAKLVGIEPHSGSVTTGCNTEPGEVSQ